MKKIILMTLLLSLFTFHMSLASQDMAAFPPAGKGMIRYVLELSPLNDEAAFKVELMVGKVVHIDEDNTYFFGGKIEKETVEGWGYTFYKVRDLGPMAGTLMAVDPNAPKIERFIQIGGGPYLIRYNSRLPLVVYVPEGVKVRYRIWSAGAQIQAMEKG